MTLWMLLIPVWYAWSICEVHCCQIVDIRKKSFLQILQYCAKVMRANLIEFRQNLPKLWDTSKRANSNFCRYWDAPIVPISLKFCMTFCSTDNEILFGKVKFWATAKFRSPFRVEHDACTLDLKVIFFSEDGLSLKFVHRHLKSLIYFDVLGDFSHWYLPRETQEILRYLFCAWECYAWRPELCIFWAKLNL